MTQTVRAEAPLDPAAIDDLLIMREGRVLYRVLVYPGAQEGGAPDEVRPTVPELVR